MIRRLRNNRIQFLVYNRTQNFDIDTLLLHGQLQGVGLRDDPRTEKSHDRDRGHHADARNEIEQFIARQFGDSLVQMVVHKFRLLQQYGGIHVSGAGADNARLLGAAEFLKCRDQPAVSVLACLDRLDQSGGGNETGQRAVIDGR